MRVKQTASRSSEELKGRLMYISVNQKHPQLSKPEVRQAIKYLVDYEGMQNSFLNGQYTIHQNFLPATYLGASSEARSAWISTRPRNCLPASSRSRSRSVSVKHKSGSRSLSRCRTPLRRLGITLNITVGTAKAILGRYRARELDMYMGAWGPDYPDPHTNAGTFAFNPDNSDEAGATGLLAWRNAWDTGGLTEKVSSSRDRE